MSNSLSALLSATFYEPGYDHVVELVHQRDRDSRRHLASLDVTLYDAEGKTLAEVPVDPGVESLDLSRMVGAVAPDQTRVMVALDARYDEQVFPYRPHHYAFLHRRGSVTPALYYAVSAALGGVPDRIDNSRINNFETYVFRRRAFGGRYGVLLGNLARFATAEAQVFAHYGAERTQRAVTVAPRAHTEVVLPTTLDGRLLQRVEVKSLFRMASYVVGRHEGSGDLVLFDHLFTYLK
jgi:hypothetical protein